MQEPAINVLMTGGGAPGAPGILRCLQAEPRIHVTVADANPQATGRFLSDDFVTIPLAEDPMFIPAVLAVCREKQIHVILPLVTNELLPLAYAAGELALAGTTLAGSPAASLEIANHKSRLYEFLQWRDIPVPRFRVAETVEQFMQALEVLGYPGKPVCFKPSVSNGSRGFRVINDRVNEPDLLFNYKPGHPFIRREDAIRILSSAPFPELLVSEYLPGEEYSVDCLARDGEPVLVLPRLRKKMIGGISVEGEFVKEENIMSYCSRVIRELRLHGNAGIQVKRAESGDFLVLEINPRVQGTIAAALGAGINLPVLGVKQALDQHADPAELHIKWGTKFLKYWIEVFY